MVFNHAKYVFTHLKLIECHRAKHMIIIYLLIRLILIEKIKKLIIT
jgi:hypothetical protein